MIESLRIGYRSDTMDAFDYHSHPEQYEIYLFHSGSCRYIIHNQILDLEPGDILLMDGSTLHKPNINRDREYIRSVIHFSPQWIEGVLKELGIANVLDLFKDLQHCLIRTDDEKEKEYIDALIYQLVERKKAKVDAMWEAELKVLLTQLLVRIHQLCESNAIKVPYEKTEKFHHSQRIAIFIRENYNEKITLDYLSENLNLSKSYISHIFKEMTGYTVMEYVMTCRLIQVKYLLEMEPDKALKDVSNECGFESVSHFSRYFKEKVGVTPKEYRNRRLNFYAIEKSTLR
ncbi:AraC-like DNA-binding protein [Gracilibacillus halotolerans]|uniref:AraC-like DNA-binding protein n=1 Tax=Gracilibacillus halotolerans TaxID=74386 RepID=A0A841RMV6_9BACI|nr:AraC family transcriptional regulator [Gracilibacillus halotolerans]MBB6513829.1 AraC-like DNA-binding protein [Gracilibacillus halotolerans]